jgi:hypothetical protein
MEKTYQIWSMGGTVTCVPAERVDEWRAKGQLDEGARMLHEFKASGKASMMRKYYEFMGWGHFGGAVDEDPDDYP